jgi:hypothetical protein
MYLRTTQRRNKDGSVVRYYVLAENVRHPKRGYVEAKVVHSFGRESWLGLCGQVFRLDRWSVCRVQAAAICGSRVK